MAVMAIWAVVLISYGFSTGIALGFEPGSDDVLPLDMAPDSVDDMYDGCKENMFKVQPKYLRAEKNKSRTFKVTWDEAEKVYNRTLYGSNELKKEEIIAIYVYTLNAVYADFNEAVRSQRSKYKTTFRYHALHFYLTSALQRLHEEQKAKGGECLTSYRGVNKEFSQNVSGKEFRFGSFTSSSSDGYDTPRKFGKKSCFKIFTCYGAPISNYSALKDLEAEVLIPPYEVFKVIKIERRSEEKSLPCQVVYEVQSTRKTLSNTNCALYTHTYMYIYISVSVCLFVFVCVACYCFFKRRAQHVI